MPVELDIQALSDRRQKLMDEVSSVLPQYQELLQTDPMAAQKLSDQYKGHRQGIEEFDALLQEKKQELLSDIAEGRHLTRAAQANKPLEFDSEGRITNADELGLDDPYQPTEEYYKRKTGEALSLVLGEDVEMDEGLPGMERVYLSMFSPEKRRQLMDERFRGESKSINVGGKEMQFYKEGDTWRPVNPIGFEAADLAMIPAEIAPSIGAMAGAVWGTGVTGGPWGGAAGAAGGYAAVGTLQDQVMSAIAGLDSNLANDFGRRSLDGMVGMPIDRVTGGVVGKPVARGMAKGRSAETFRDIVRAEEQYLAGKGVKLRSADLLEGGLEKAARRAEAADRLPLTRLGRDYNEVLYRAKKFKENAPKAQKSQDLYESALDNLRHSAAQSAKMVEMYDQRAADVLRNAQNRRMEQILPNYKEVSNDSIGLRVHDALVEARKASEDAKNKFYNEKLYPATEAAGISVDPVAFAKAARAAHWAEGARSPQVDKVIKELMDRPKNARKIQKLEKKLSEGKLLGAEAEKAATEIERLRALSGPLDAKEMDKYVRRLKKAHPPELVGQDEVVLAAGRASRAAEQFRNDIYDQNGLMNLYREAQSKYDSFRALERNQLGGILKDVFGESKLTPTQITQRITGDPRTATQVLDAIRSNAPDRYGETLDMARQAYLKKAGIAEKRGMLPKSLDYDADMVEALWGRDQFGRKVPGASKRMTKILDDLNNDFKKYNIDASKIEVDDLTKLQSAFDPQEFKILRGNVIARAKNQAEAEKALSTSLISIAKKGHREALQSHEFPKAMWDANSSDLGRVLQQFKDPVERKNLEGDFMEYFFAKYPPTGEYGPYGKDLWDGELFLKDIARDPKIKANLKKVVGDDKFNDMVAYSTVMQSAKRPRASSVGTRGGGTANEQGAKIHVPLTAAVERFGDLYHAAMWRAGFLPVVGRGGKDVTPEAFAEAYESALKKLFTTSEGIQALTLTGRHDPNWGGHLGEMLGIEGENNEETGAARGYK